MRTQLHIAAAACGMLLSTAALSANDPVLEWNAIMVSTTAGQNPFFQARSAAVTQLAVFEAVNAIDRDFDPYLGTIHAPHTASEEAAAIAAAHAVLKNYFPANAAALDTARATSLAAIPDGIRKEQGIAVGEAAAAAMIALRADDGSTPPEFFKPTSSDAGEWQPTPSCPPAGGLLLQWQNLRPFAIETTAQFRSAPPPAIKSLRYARDFWEVRLVGDVNSPFRPQDRADVALFYAATPPVPVWNAAASQVAAEQGRSMSESARALALVNMAISDAQATVFETKYHYRLWRPETAIRAGDQDGNLLTRGDPNFMPLVVTPCFPSYASAHGSSSGAAREVLERLFGARHHFIALSNPAVPGVVLQYGSFRQITQDVADARVYGGIHFRFDQEAGAKIGLEVGAYVQRHALRRR
ncbi:MAG TPA: vanadium-dependent haloperoxidase [Steroidobacteraceae bacterium]|nr:vanadium-dependent haloperoxidase [Steroidobacteraceae bacterium]